VHPHIKDKSSFDEIANYNNVVLKAELDVENNRETKFKNLLHEDGILKKISISIKWKTTLRLVSTWAQAQNVRRSPSQ